VDEEAIFLDEESGASDVARHAEGRVGGRGLDAGQHDVAVAARLVRAVLDDPSGGDLVRHRGVEDDADVLDDALVRGEQGGRALGLLKSVAGGDVSADPLPDEAVGALGARGEVNVGDDPRLRGGEGERGEQEESGVRDARHGGVWLCCEE
jgi:hypothetical protein